MNSHPKGANAVDISVVVPVYNEAGNITKLHHEIVAAVSSLTDSFEIIYVNDGSTDGSLAELHALSRATIINLNRNYGQSTAFDAGFKACVGDLVVSMDGDGQDDPKNIPNLIQKLREDDLDVVAGWRRDRSDKGGIRVLTRIGRVLRRIMIADDIHDSGCALRVYKHEAVKSLDIGGEMHRYILALLRWKGFTIGEIEVNHRPRIHGVSKYNYTKAFRGFLDLIYIWFIHKYSQRPLHLFGYLSMGAFALSFAAGMWSLYGKMFLDLSLNRNGWFFLTFFFMLAGIMLFSFGVIIDLLIRIHLDNSTYEKRYYVRQVVRK